MALNLEKQLLFYGAYHHDPVNVWIHIVCVPAILMTSFLLLGWAAPGPQWAQLHGGAVRDALGPLLSRLEVPYLPPNLGTVGAFLYATLYVLMEPVAGGMLAPLILGGTAAMNYLVAEHGMAAVRAAGGVFVASWIAQFVGHGRFEGRAPALLDNLVQALFLAPLFVWLEVLFMLGYRPGLRSRIDAGIQKELEKFRREKEEKEGKEAAVDHKKAEKAGDVDVSKTNGVAGKGKAKAKAKS